MPPPTRPTIPFSAYHRDAIDTATRLRKDGWLPAKTCTDPRVCEHDDHPDVMRRQFYTRISRADPTKPAAGEDWVTTVTDDVPPLQTGAPGGAQRAPLRAPPPIRTSRPPPLTTDQLGPLYKYLQQMRTDLDVLTAKINTGVMGLRYAGKTGGDIPNAPSIRLPVIRPNSTPADALAKLQDYANLLTPAGAKKYRAQVRQQAGAPARPSVPRPGPLPARSGSATAGARAPAAPRGSSRAPARSPGTGSTPPAAAARPATPQTGTASQRVRTLLANRPATSPRVYTGTPQTMLTATGPTPNLYPKATPTARTSGRQQASTDDTATNDQQKPTKKRRGAKVTRPKQKSPRTIKAQNRRRANPSKPKGAPRGSTGGSKGGGGRLPKPAPEPPKEMTPDQLDELNKLIEDLEDISNGRILTPDEVEALDNQIDAMLQVLEDMGLIDEDTRDELFDELHGHIYENNTDAFEEGRELLPRPENLPPQEPPPVTIPNDIDGDTVGNSLEDDTGDEDEDTGDEDIGDEDTGDEDEDTGDEDEDTGDEDEDTGDVDDDFTADDIEDWGDFEDGGDDFDDGAGFDADDED